VKEAVIFLRHRGSAGRIFDGLDGPPWLGYDCEIDHARDFFSAAVPRTLNIDDGNIACGIRESPGGTGPFEAVETKRWPDLIAEHEFERILRR
jgi:hypothetical protein